MSLSIMQLSMHNATGIDGKTNFYAYVGMADYVFVGAVEEDVKNVRREVLWLKLSVFRKDRKTISC